MKFYSIKKQNNHILFKFLFLKIKFKIKLKKKLSHPVLVMFSLYGMGDYILQRRYFKYIKLSPKYKNSSIIFVCRNAFTDFVRTYDSQYFDEIIEIDKNKLKNIFYRNSIISKINSLKPDDLYFASCLNLNKIKPKHDVVSDNYYSLFKNIKAKNKYTSYYGNNPNLKNDVFNKLFYFGDNEMLMFEEERLRKEYEYLLGISINNKISGIQIPLENEKKHIAVSIFASSKERMLKFNDWKNIINYITDNTDSSYEIVFLGDKSEEKYINTLIKNVNSPEKCINMGGGNTSLIPIILKSCQFLISVESGNVHIAHEVGCKTICISGSFAYGRFHPYNDNLIKYVYPEKFSEYIKSNGINTQLKEEFYASENDINEVKKIIKEYLY